MSVVHLVNWIQIQRIERNCVVDGFRKSFAMNIVNVSAVRQTGSSRSDQRSSAMKRGDNRSETCKSDRMNEVDNSTPLKLQVVNLSGTRFELSENIWAMMKKNVPEVYHSQIHVLNNEVYIGRHPSAFQSILYYEQGGELHLPRDMCPSSFKKELEFWDVHETCLAKCCFAKYMGYFDDELVLKVCRQYCI